MITTQERRGVYLNAKQLEFVQHDAQIGLFLGGRGVGKSTVGGGKHRRRMSEIPRAHTFLSSSTYGQILEKTLASFTEMLERMGIVEGIHFVIGKTPPPHFKRPYSAPRSFKNVISFYNGNAISMLSMDRPDLARGGSYQGGEVDEAALVPEEHFKRVLLPAQRGCLTRFRNKPIYRQVNLLSSVPWKSKGRWILDYIDKALKDPSTYHVTESVSADNIAVLGQDYIDLMRKELSPLEFAREIMNQVLNRAERMYYHNFDEDRHVQTTTYDYNDSDEGIEIAGKAEYWPEQLFELSWDFGGWFTGFTAYQADMIDGTPYEYMIDSMAMTEGQDMVRPLVDNFCHKYQNHQYKVVRIWGEPRGHDRNAVDLSMYEIIEEQFAKWGWRVVVQVRAVRTALHIPRHEFLNHCLSEKDNTFPRLRILLENCEDPITSMMTAEIKPDGKKDKKDEKDRDFPQQKATHYSDTVDYYLFYKYSPLVGGLMSSSGGGYADTETL